MSSTFDGENNTGLTMEEMKEAMQFEVESGEEEAPSLSPQQVVRLAEEVRDTQDLQSTVVGRLPRRTPKQIERDNKFAQELEKAKEGDGVVATATLPLKKTGVVSPLEYTDRFFHIMAYLADRGFTVEEMAYVLGCHRSRVVRWRSDPRFSECLVQHRAVADAHVERALFRRAPGMTRKEQKITSNGRIVEYEKYYAPDVLACVFWLCNRKPMDWKNKKESSVDVRGGDWLSVVQQAMKVQGNAKETPRTGQEKEAEGRAVTTAQGVRMEVNR